MSHKRILRLLASFLAGAVLSNASVFGTSAPLAAAFPLILSPACGAASAIGAAVFAIFLHGRAALPLISALGAAFLLKLHRSRSALNAAAIASGVYVLAACALSVLSGGGFGEIVSILVSGLFSFITFAAYIKAARYFNSSSLIPSSLTALCFFIASLAFSGAGIGAMSFGAMIGAYAVLLMSVRYGAGASCLAAILTAAGAGISSPENFSCLMLLGIPAAVCGFTSVGSPIRAAALMLASISPAAVLFGLSAGSLSVILDCALASVIFVLTYPISSKFCLSLFDLSPKRRTSSRPERLCTALSDISERLYRLSEREPEQEKSFAESVRARVCAGCDRNENCRGEGIASAEKMTDAADIYRALPECSKVPEIRRVGAEVKKRGEYMNLKAAESRETARFCSDMLLGIEKIISDLYKYSDRAPEPDPLLSDRLEKQLARKGYKVQSASVMRSGGCEISLSISQKINEVRICSTASEITGFDYLKPERTAIGESVLLRLTPITAYSADSGICQLSAKKEASGDVAECFTCGGCFYAILSDGMGRGSGARAAAMTLIGVLRELITAGFSVSSSISLASLILKASLPEESFATLDILKVDLETGMAEMSKAGGCESYVLSDGVKSKIRPGGYPAGIISPCEAPPQRFFIHDEALILMMTDGAQGLTPESFFAVSDSEKNLPLHELAALLMGKCGAENSLRSDDISLLIVKIKKKGYKLL